MDKVLYAANAHLTGGRAKHSDGDLPQPATSNSRSGASRTGGMSRFGVVPAVVPN
jgi:hypothetical protein